MNPEELYLQYQSNGGNLSLEDFLNMQSYLEPNDFSALIQDTTTLKKKDDTNTGLLSSQGLSISNNGENINPISIGQNIQQETLSAPIDSQLDLNQNQLDQQNGVSNLVNSNSESALTSGNNGTPFTTNLPINTQNPLSYKGNMDNLVLDENGNAKSKVGTISFPNDNPNNNTTTFNSGVTVPNIYLPDESKVDFTQLPKNYLSPRQYKPGELLDYSYQDFTGANINDPESYAKDLESKGYIKPSYLKDGTRATLENGLPAFEITKNGAEYFTKESEKYVEWNNYEAAKQKLSPDKPELTDLEKYTNSLFDKYGYLVTEEDRSNYLQSPEGRKELQITLETQQELGSYPNATYQQVYDMVSRRYNKPDEFYLDKAQSVLSSMMDNQKQTAFDDFSNRFGSDNEIMPDDIAENKFYLEVEKNYDLKKLFGEFLDSEEGQLYTRTDQSIRNNTNGQRNRKNIWNAFSNWTNKKELLDIEAKQNNISNLKYNVQSAAETGDFNLVNQYVNQINSVQNSIQNNIKNVQQNDSITSNVNKIFTRVNKEDSEAQDFQARVLSGDGIARTQNILGQVVLGLGQSAMDASSGILRILTTPFSQNLKDSVDQLNEPLKLGNIEISPLRTNVTKYSDNSGRIYEERNGKLFQIENGIYKPVSNISGLKETGKDSEYNPSGMAFLTGKMAGDILITNEVGGLINNTITNNAISLASKTTQAFGAESEIAKQARNFARYAQSANSAENKSVSGWFVQMYNDSYKNAEDSGISSTAGKTVYATVNSFIQSLIQRINPDSKFLSGFNNEYKQLLSSLSTSNGERILANAKSLFSKIGDNVVGETKEELIQQVVGDMTNYVTNVISGSDFKLTDSEGYKDVVVGTIVPSAIASLMGGSGSRNIKLGNNEINLSNYNRSQLLTELSRFDGANNMLKIMSNDSSFDSYSNTLDDVKNEVLTRQKYINKIPDSQNYSTESLDNAIKVLQQLETKRNDLNQADAAFKPRIESEISSLESEVDQILNQISTNENTTSPKQTPEGTQGQEKTNTQSSQDAFTRPEPTGDNSTQSYLIKDKSLIEKLQKAGVEEKVIQALPENFRINEKWLMGDKGESLLSRIMKSAFVAGQNYSVVERDNNDQILNYDTGRVDINKLAKFFGKDVLYHETVHAATVLTMEDMRINPQNYTEEEMAAHDNLYSEIKRLNQLKKSGNKANPKGASLYGLSNQYEFVAEFMSNNKFREWVGNISNESSDAESNNLLQKIWNNIKSMLGLNTNKPNIDNEYLNNIQNNIDVILNKQRETNEKQGNQQNDIRQITQQSEQQSSFNENASVESTNSPTETIRQNENAQTSNVSEEVNFDDLLSRVNKIFNEKTRSSTNSNERVQSTPNINQEQQTSNNETVQTNELPRSTNQVEVNPNDLRSQEISVSNELNPNQTRLSENVIATTKEIRLPDGDSGYRVTVTDNNGNLIEDRNGDSEFDFSDQSEVDKFINQKQRGFSLSKQPRIKTEVQVTESTSSSNYIGKRVSFNQFGDTRSGVVESENKGRLTIKGDDGKTYFTGSPLVQNLKDESGNPIQLQRSSENFIPISQEAFDSLIEKLKKPFAKAFKNLNIITDWNEFINNKNTLDGINNLDELSSNNVVVNDNDIKLMQNNGIIYGAKLPDGTIYINPEHLNANTPIHEFSHLWEQLMPSRFKNGVELLKQTKTGKEIFNRLKSEGNYNNLSDNELWNEALNTHIGNYGEWQFQERQARGKMAEFVQWFKAFFNKIGDVLGIGNINPNVSLNNFTNKVLGDISGNKYLTPESNYSISAGTNFSIRNDNTNKLKIKDDVELSNFFGDNTTSIDELIAKGYKVSDDIANLARKFGTKIYIINDNLFDKSKSQINNYVNDLMKDYQILIDNGTYEESYIRQELLDNITKSLVENGEGEANGNSIYLQEWVNDSNNTPKTKVLQHELAHVFTSYYLADKIDSSQLNEQELTFRNEARSAYEEALKNPNKTNAYGYSNTYEFIAEYIANDNFKSEVDNYLDSLNNPESKSLLTKIVDYIKELFGVKSNTELKQEFQLQKSIYDHINRLNDADGSINLQAYSGVRFMIKKLMPVSTIQEVLNETETNGIEAGLAKFKESAFYNSLSDKQKAIIDSEGISKLMQEQVILHREDQINKKRNAVEKAKEQTSKKEKDIAFNKIEKIHENYKNKIEELRKSNKSYREKVAERKRQAKEAYDNTVIFLNKNMISGKITPTEVSRLLKAATGILSTRNSISNFNKFTELYNKINVKAEERNKTQIEKTTDKYNEVSQTVEQQFNSGKSLQEIKDSFNSIDEQRMAESAYNRLANKTISPEEARKKLDDSYKSSKDVLTKRFKDENGNIMSFNQKFRAWLKNKVERGIVSGVDRQFIPKRILENIGAKAVSNRMIAYAGSSTIAKEKFDKVQKSVYDGLNRSELELLDKIIAAKRFIAIDKNREEKGLSVVDHPGYQDASTAQKALDAYKSEIGEYAFTKLNKRADAYFDAFKNILSDMRESGLISSEVYEELKDVDYQPRKFLRYILDADGELISSDRSMFRNENGNLSKEQIMGLSEGDASDMLMDSKWLIQSALASRYKAIGMNEINRTFFTKYYPDAKAKFESINPDNISEGDKKFFKYFKQLQSNIKENRIIGFTESGKPKYESTTPEGYKIAYYYENGVRHQVFMKEEFHKMWHDTMDKLINSDLAQTISTLSGSRLVKAFATGNNPGFVFTNTPRDFVHALLFSPEYSSFLLKSGVQLTKDSIKAIGEIYKHRNSNKTTLLTKYLEYGGGMEWLNQQGEIKDLTSLNKTIGNYFDSRIDPKSKKILSTLFDFARLKSLSNYSETMFRVAVFDRSLQNQLKEYNKLNNTSYKSVEELSNEDKNNMYYEAVASSRGLLDFNQGGNSTKQLESFIPYLNAATQGTRVMVDAIKQNPIGTSIRFIQAAGLPVLGMHLMMNFIMGLIRPPEKEDEPVNKSYADFLDGISPAQKMNYWNIPVGWDKEEKQWKVLRIAKAQQLTPISILFEGAYEDHIRSSVGMTKRGSIKDTWKNFAKALGDNIDPTHLASALEEPKKSKNYFESAFKLVNSIPTLKGLIQYFTGYDTFKEQPLSFDINKVSRKYEGADKANVEEFYKELGKVLDDSPVRLKVVVESIITSPQTNPFVGIMYGGADAIVTDVDAKKRAGVIYDSFIKRILSETSDFNRQLNKKALVQEQLDKNTDEYGETRNKAKQILNKYGSVNELLKNEKSLIADIEGYSKDPVIQKDLVNRIKSLVKKDGISSMVFDVKYGTNNNIKNKALLIYTYAEGMSATEKRRFFEQLQSQKILSKAVISEYENVIKQNKK